MRGQLQVVGQSSGQSRGTTVPSKELHKDANVQEFYNGVRLPPLKQAEQRGIP